MLSVTWLFSVISHHILSSSRSLFVLQVQDRRTGTWIKSFKELLGQDSYWFNLLKQSSSTVIQREAHELDWLEIIQIKTHPDSHSSRFHGYRRHSVSGLLFPHIQTHKKSYIFSSGLTDYWTVQTQVRRAYAGDACQIWLIWLISIVSFSSDGMGSTKRSIMGATGSTTRNVATVFNKTIIKINEKLWKYTVFILRLSN